MHRIALVNQKGGVGKTTTAVNLSACLAALGRRVLLVDLDPQANTSISFGVHPDAGARTTYNLIRGDCAPAEAIVTLRPGLDLLPASIDLAGAEVELAGVIGRECALREALKALTAYDYVIVDCPPSLGLLNVNALAYVNEVFIPLQCQYFALHGVSLLVKTIDLVKRRINPALELAGVIPCMYDGRTGLSREVVSEIEKYFAGRVFATRIRTNVRLAEAPSHGKPIAEYAPDSYGAEDYRALAREVMMKNGDPLPAEAPAPTAPAVPTPPERAVATPPATAAATGIPQPAPASAVPVPSEATPGRHPERERGADAPPPTAVPVPPAPAPPPPGPPAWALPAAETPAVASAAEAALAAPPTVEAALVASVAAAHDLPASPSLPAPQEGR